MDILGDLDTLIIALVIGIITSFLVQVIKSYKNQKIANLQGLNIMIGLALGLISMAFTGLDFTSSAILGLAGGVYSPGIYDMITTAFSLEDDIDGDN